MMAKSTILTNQQARNAVGALSVALGGVALVLPRETAGAFGVDRTAGPVPLLVRMIGVRNVTMGVRTLQSSGDEQARTLKAGFVASVPWTQLPYWPRGVQARSTAAPR